MLCACDKSNKLPYTEVYLKFQVKKYLFISDFLKGIELLLLGCFKLNVMNTSELISSGMPGGT